MHLSDAHIEADDNLASAASEVHVLRYVNPIADDDTKPAFLKSRTSNPRFQYRAPAYATNAVGQTLEDLEIPDDEIGSLLAGVRKKLLLENRIIQHLGDAEIVRECSLELFGQPDEQLVRQADQLLKTLEKSAQFQPKNHTSEDLVDAFNSRFRKEWLTDWRAEVSDTALVVTTDSNGVIRVPPAKKYSDADLTRLENHEIGAHVLQTENGRSQALEIFSYGLMRYWATTEGLALYCQDRTGTLTDKEMISYAGRVIAVDSVYQDLDFRGTYNRLMDYGKFSKGEAYTLTLRAHRAGGYLKDMIYLSGLNEVRKFADDGGDISELYIGKIALEQLDRVRKLQESGVLCEAKRLPWFMDELR